MVISGRSWHYRYFQWLKNPSAFGHTMDSKYVRKEPKSICSYFWVLALSPLELIMLAAWLVFAATVFVGLMALLGPFVLFMDWYDKRKARRTGQPSLPRQHGLLLSYISAKKRRVCPLITVRHDDEVSA